MAKSWQQRILIFLYLGLLLLSALLRPAVDLDVRSVPKTFLIRIHLPQMAVLETSFSCALALLGYFRGRLDGIGYSVFGKTRWPEILLFAVDSNFYAKLVEQFWRVFAVHERE